MTLRLGALHDALLDPGNPEKARHAAEEVAGYESRFTRIERDLTLLKWMMSAMLALLATVLWQGFAIMGRLPGV